MQVVLSDFIGTELEDSFGDFDLTEIQSVLLHLQNTDPIDLSHAEQLQQQALRGADILTAYLGKIIKTTGYLEAEVNSTKNRLALEYKDPSGGKTTADQRKFASECSEEVKVVQIRLAKAKAAKSVLEKKYDILIRCHHHYKDIAQGLRRTVMGYNQSQNKVPEGYE